MHKSDSVDILWLKLSGHLLSCQNDVYICLTYIVPKNSSRNVFITTSVYDRVLLHITEISTACNGACTFIVLGDLNLVDYVENDYFNPHVNLLPDYYNFDVPLLRSSRDTNFKWPY